MRIGEQLQKQRQINQLSQNDLAEKLHISRQSISKWENGSILPSFANVVAISDLFQISLDELIRGDADLMNKMENEHGTSKSADIVMYGVIIAVIGFAILKLIGVSGNALSDWFTLPIIVCFIGFLYSVRWRDFNKALTKSAVIWGAVWVALILVPEFYSFIQGFIEGNRDAGHALGVILTITLGISF
ncbi:helix-turn-helix domain-containing protein [Lentilactobacillus diolivorans]|uniref:DNA-binding helix-turn-helix protein n=2 Tax=Lentilactobacillus diolivorans TaxID=179838 RepID=A0A0R1SLL8_9LACO|nr:helix-turn-helix transcriptional regulator [Lentilactobacillus diolivorans]KRL69999.1 DNA-binding helix-turn-helix protein [Lentilactobacillus diolivorans DSM 14421]GEP24517.1 hypothetical protein LDI01_21100 [Lentilactobacillus diolivorans]